MNAEQRRKVRRARTERGACPECGEPCAPSYRCEAHRAARRLYRKTARMRAELAVRS